MTIPGKKYIAACLSGILILAIAAVTYTYRGHEGKRVTVIFSYDEGHQSYAFFRKSLEKAFRDKGYDVDITYHYLDAIALRHNEEINTINHLLSNMEGTARPDLLMTVGDEVTYSFLHCTEPVKREIPVVFGSVFYPNWDRLRKFPNVTGLQDSVNVVKNILLTNQLCDNYAAFTLLSNHTLDKAMKRMAERQLDPRRDIINNMRWNHTMMQIFQSANMEKYSITAFSLEDLTLNTMAAPIHRDSLGRENMLTALNNKMLTYIQLKYDAESMNMVALKSMKPMLTGIWYDYGTADSKYLGGYFASGSSIAQEMADRAVRIFQGTQPKDIPYATSRQQYHIDWQVAKRFGWKREDLPKDFVIDNLSFGEEYPTLYLIYVYGSWTLAGAMLIALFWFYRMMTKEKRKAQQQIQNEVVLFSMITHDNQTFVWERKGTTINFRKGFWEHFGQEHHNIDIEDFKVMIHPDYVKYYEEGILHVERGEMFTNEILADFHRKGEYHWYQVSGKGVLDKRGNYISSYGMVRNIDDFKAREEELKEARRKAEEATLKESFLANMSHEIRTPLNAIVGFSDLLSDPHGEFSPEERQLFMETIKKNNKLLLRLINDILDISRIESGQMSFCIKPHSVNELMDKVYHSNVLQMPKHLKFIYDKPTYDATIQVDSDRLSQVLSNFLTNAGKFTPQGSVTLGWRLLPDTQQAELYVEDTGIGLSESDRKMVFSRFFKKDEFKQGTGLGLSICKVIVSRLQGSIKVKSALGKGSRFSVFLTVSSNNSLLAQD